MKLKAKKTKNVTIKKTLLLNESSPFSVRESFNLLRTNIIYTSTDSKGAPVYGVASTVASSGKSTVMANLAVQLGSMSKKVLLIDADMRCPMQNKIFGYEKNHYGLSEFLSGVIKTKEEGIIKTDCEGLYIMPSGLIPPNPAELLMSNKFKELLDEIKQEYDYVLLDFPPIGVVSDSAAAVNYIDGYIFVARAYQSKIGDVKATIDRLEGIGGKIVGIVLNDVESKTGRYGRYRRYGGKYGKYGRYGQYGPYGRYGRYGRYGNNNNNYGTYRNHVENENQQ